MFCACCEVERAGLVPVKFLGPWVIMCNGCLARMARLYPFLFTDGSPFCTCSTDSASYSLDHENWHCNYCRLSKGQAYHEAKLQGMIAAMERAKESRGIKS